MRPLKNMVLINKHVHTKKNFFPKTSHIIGVENFNVGAKYKKMKNFYLQHFFLFKTSKHF